MNDKIIIAVASITIVYYSIGAVKEIFELIEMSKIKYYKTCTNLRNISDYICAVKRCNYCGKTFKYKKSFNNHFHAFY
jgi:hypothetical protein